MNGISIRDTYQNGKRILSKAGLESPAFDALCLLDLVFGTGGRSGLAIHGGEPADPDKYERFNELIIRRTREPLQYILGKWEFDGMALHVGEGVLIPREDTLTLVETACELLKGKTSPRVLDLCAGSGAVGLAIARRIPDAYVLCVEKSPLAFGFFTRNRKDFGCGRVEGVICDVLHPPEMDQEFDCIVSNPPYIPTGDIEGLAWEVQCEPKMALDGGSDGLIFYKAICSQWTRLLCKDGIVAFEVGYDIRDGVIDVMRRAGVGHIDVVKDFGGIDRCIFGTVVS